MFLISRLLSLLFGICMHFTAYAGIEAPIAVGSDGNLLVTFADGSTETFVDGGVNDLDRKADGVVTIGLGPRKIRSYIRQFFGVKTTFNATSLNNYDDHSIFLPPLELPNFSFDVSAYLSIDIDVLFEQQGSLSIGQEFEVINGLILGLPYLTIFDGSSFDQFSLEEIAMLDQAAINLLPTFTGITHISSVDSIYTVDEPSTIVLCTFALIILRIGHRCGGKADVPTALSAGLRVVGTPQETGSLLTAFMRGRRLG